MRNLLVLSLLAAASLSRAVSWDFDLNVDDSNPNLTVLETQYIPLSATLDIDGANSVTIVSRSLSLGGPGGIVSSPDETPLPLTAFGPGYDNDNVLVLPVLDRVDLNVPTGSASFLDITLTDSLGSSITHRLNFQTYIPSTPPPPSTPEPASLLALGLGAFGMVRDRRRR